MKKLLIAISMVWSACATHAQVPGTGAYAYASFDNRGFDAVNLGNLNTRFTISIVNRVGRGLPFNYVIQNEGLIWAPVTTGSTTAWVPDPSWGFNGQLNGTGFSGYLVKTTTMYLCPGMNPRYTGSFVPSSKNFVYTDSFGAEHFFNYTYRAACPGYPAMTTGDGSTSDGSGYTILNPTQIKSLNGVVFTPAQTTAGQNQSSSTDSNGNEISFNGTGSFTDTLGATALTIGGSDPVTYTYPVTSQANGATTASAILTYQSYTVRTSFGCSGIIEYGTNTVNLVSRITLADGSFYAFSYEGTPGATDGAVTARIASITLPTGGVISYTRSGGCNGSGINADGTVSGLTRTTGDGTRTYNRTTLSSDSTSTTLQDEKGNQTALTFTDATGMFYETYRKVYQGAIGGSLLLERFTCYNGSATSCDGVAITPPLTEVDTTESYNGGSQAITKNTLSTNGALIAQSSKFSGATLLQKTTYTYNSLGEVLTQTTTDGSGNQVTSATFGYDETGVTGTSGIPQHTAVASSRGNMTSSHISTGSSTLTTTTSYYDTGQPIAAVTPGPQTTQYGYDATQTFQTQTILPQPSSRVSLSTSASYDPTSTALLTSTGMNAGETTSILQYDALLRPISVSLANGSAVSYSYTSPNHMLATQTLGSNTGQNSERELLLDGYGRKSRLGLYNGQSQNPWYQVDYCYDQSGLPQFVPTPYQGQGEGSPIRCSGSGTSYQYDALDRVTKVANDDGPETITYLNRAVETTDVNGVQRITQYDLLGRISGICEISSNSMGDQSPTACGMDISGTGYVSSYAYNLAAHTVTITQGAQQRTVQTDAAGRTIAVTEPERGSTTYSYAYNSTGLQIVRARPQANQPNANVFTHTTTQYDSLGRVVSISYDDGLTPSKTYAYDTNASWGWSNFSPTNLKGRLYLAYNPGGPAATTFSYDLMGNVNEMAECVPSGCGNGAYDKHLFFSYDLGGNLTYKSDPESGGITYGRTPAGEVTSMTSTYNSTGNPPTLVSNVVNTPFGPTSYTLGNGLAAVATYDTLGRNNGNWVCNGSSASYCAGGTKMYGNSLVYKGSQVTSGCDTTVQCQTNGYDELNRLTSVTQTSNNTVDSGSYAYTYDRYGNRLTQTQTSGTNGVSSYFAISLLNNNQLRSATYDAAGNEVNDGVSHTYTYDAEGNVIQVDGGATAQYLYDALNRRVRVQTSAATNEYVFDPAGHRLSTWPTSSNSGTEGRIYMGGKLLAYRAQDGTTYFQHMNALQTTRIRTNYQGQNATTESSLPYGDDLQQYGSTYSLQDNAAFAGQDYDTESMTSHAQFRQYSLTQGRWMSADPYDGSYNPANPQSFNRYSYVLNNPLVFTDRAGLNCDSDGNCDGGGGASGGDGGCPSGQIPDQSGNCYVDNGTGVPVNLGTVNVSPYGPPPDPQGPTIQTATGQGSGAGGGGGGAPSNPPTVPHTCQQNRILNAVPGSTLTNPNDMVGTSVGGHNQFGINVTTAQLGAAGFTPFNPFGVSDGYHNGNVFFQVHDNGSGGLITQGHIDTFNPASGLFGFVGHSIWDVGIGILLQHLFPHSHGLLDPGC